MEAEYRLQRLVYALACFRDGATGVDTVYQFLEQPDDVVSAMFTPDDVSSLEQELSASIARIREGVFEPTPSELRRLPGSNRSAQGRGRVRTAYGQNS